MPIINARPDVTSALIEAILTVLTVFSTAALQWIVLQVKARRLQTKGSTHISEADMRDSISVPFLVFCNKRCWTIREFITAVLAITVLVSKPTVLLGTRPVPCPYDPAKYAFRTQFEETLCYQERPIPTSGEAYAALGARFVELVDVEPDVPLKQHPQSFDIEWDQIVGDGILEQHEIWGTVESIETCPYNITYLRVENTDGFRISASEELVALKSDNSTINPPEIVLDRLSRFGYLRDRGQFLTAISYFKEIGRDGNAVVFMLTGLVDETRPLDEPVDSHCVMITFTGLGLRTLPFANTAVQLMVTGGNMTRIAEVAWLGATLSEQIPRQVPCIRSNYKLSQCVQLSLNTLITIAVASAFTVVVGIVMLALLIINWRNPVVKEFTQFNLLMSAVREKHASHMVSDRMPRRVKLRIGTNACNKKMLKWDMAESSESDDEDWQDDVASGTHGACV